MYCTAKNNVHLHLGQSETSLNKSAVHIFYKKQTISYRKIIQCSMFIVNLNTTEKKIKPQKENNMKQNSIR